MGTVIKRRDYEIENNKNGLQPKERLCQSYFLSVTVSGYYYYFLKPSIWAADDISGFGNYAP